VFMVFSCGVTFHDHFIYLAQKGKDYFHRK